MPVNATDSVRLLARFEMGMFEAENSRTVSVNHKLSEIGASEHKSAVGHATSIDTLSQSMESTGTPNGPHCTNC